MERPKYILIEHADGTGPWSFRAFATKQERQAATVKAIFGEISEEDMQAHAGEWASYLYTLEEDGLLTFEGDPGIEWRTGWFEEVS